MDRLLEAVETLSKASSCGNDSMMSSVMESISEMSEAEGAKDEFGGRQVNSKRSGNENKQNF
jgi:hypothetical protein